jgi:hypothetical protein
MKLLVVLILPLLALISQAETKAKPGVPPGLENNG